MRTILTYSIVFMIATVGFIGCEDDSVLPPPPDEQVPLSPTDLSGEAVSATEINLVWNDRSENEDGFEIHESIGDQTNFQLISSTEADITSKNLTGKQPATTYHFKLCSFNQLGTSDFSNTITAVTPEIPPDAPSDLSAVAASSTQINLTWSDNSDNEIGFKIERKTGEVVVWTEIKQTVADVENYEDSGLTSGTEYFYRIRAFNNTYESDYSNETSAPTLEIRPEAPAILQAQPISSGRIDISWQANSENHQGFRIERKLAIVDWYSSVSLDRSAGISALQDTGLVANTMYNYRMVAYNEQGDSDYSNIVSATTNPESELIPPSNLTAEAASSDQINLEWTDNSGNEDGFKIERREEGGSWEEIQQVGADVEEYRDTGLTPATKYYYIVRAFKDDDDSDPSEEASATTEDIAPVAPDSLHAETASSSQINLYWTVNSTNEQGFRIERKTGESGSYSQIAEVGQGVDEYQDTGLEPATKYYYRVCAFNGIGASDYSDESWATTSDEPPEAPNNLYAAAESTNQINLNWEDKSDNEDGFKIERSPEGQNWAEIWDVSANVESFHDIGLEPSTTYYYRICAYNSVGNSGYSNIASATTPDPPEETPEAPSGLQAEAVSASQIDLEWTDNSDNEVGFKIERSLDGDEWTEIQQVDVDVAEYQDTDLESNTTHHYRVRAFNDAGDSDYSNETSATTPDTPEAGDERVFELGDTGVMITMCWIPPGEFMMGRYENEQNHENDEDPQHRVTFNDGFWMGKYEVTQVQWEAVMDDWDFAFDGNPDNPAEMMSWDDVQQFESRLDNVYRLPSESEWEYACRAGTTTRFYWGDDSTYVQILEYAWCSYNSDDSTHSVGDKNPNNWGLYDISGNVLEWCEDWYHGDYNGAPDDGSAWIAGGEDRRVVRGGDWSSRGWAHRSANRDYSCPDNNSDHYGFRLVRDAD